MKEKGERTKAKASAVRRRDHATIRVGEKRRIRETGESLSSASLLLGLAVRLLKVT